MKIYINCFLVTIKLLYISTNLCICENAGAYPVLPLKSSCILDKGANVAENIKEAASNIYYSGKNALKKGYENTQGSDKLLATHGAYVREFNTSTTLTDSSRVSNNINSVVVKNNDIIQDANNIAYKLYTYINILCFFILSKIMTSRLNKYIPITAGLFNGDKYYTILNSISSFINGAIISYIPGIVLMSIWYIYTMRQNKKKNQENVKELELLLESIDKNSNDGKIVEKYLSAVKKPSYGLNYTTFVTGSIRSYIMAMTAIIAFIYNFAFTVRGAFGPEIDIDSYNWIVSLLRKFMVPFVLYTTFQIIILATDINGAKTKEEGDSIYTHLDHSNLKLTNYKD